MNDLIGQISTKWNSSLLQQICKWHANHLLPVTSRVKSAQNRLINSSISWTVTENSAIVWLFVVEISTSNSRPSDCNFFLNCWIQILIRLWLKRRAIIANEWPVRPFVTCSFILATDVRFLNRQKISFFSCQRTQWQHLQSTKLSQEFKKLTFFTLNSFICILATFRFLNVSITWKMVMNSIKIHSRSFAYSNERQVAGLSLTEKNYCYCKV